MRPRETLRWSCDVLVVGAGPAGSMAARKAAEKGVSVILLERRDRVGTPVRCAEFAPRVVGRFLSLTENVISQPIDAMETHVADAPEVRMVVNGLMLHRDRFDHALALQAVAAGARLETRVRAMGVQDRLATAIRGGTEITINARVIVGADGPLSTVGRSIGCTNQVAHAYSPVPRGAEEAHRDHQGLFPSLDYRRVRLGIPQAVRSQRRGRHPLTGHRKPSIGPQPIRGATR